MSGKVINVANALWDVDLANCTASHSTGLVVQFVKAEDNKHAWDGVALNDDVWFTKHFKTMPNEELQAYMATLMREAGEAYLAALQRRQ